MRSSGFPDNPQLPPNVRIGIEFRRDFTFIVSETFEEFRKSFSYGSRTDLAFKFISGMSDDDGGRFFQLLLRSLGDAFDSGDYGEVRRLCREWQVQAYTPDSDWAPKFKYDTAPWQPLRKPLSESRLVLVSPGGSS